MFSIKDPLAGCPGSAEDEWEALMVASEPLLLSASDHRLIRRCSSSLMSVPSSHIDLIGQEESEGQQRHGNRYAQANGREGGQSEEPGEQEQRKDTRDLASPLIPADSHL